MKKRVCIYSRVSKETGDYQRQISELKKSLMTTIMKLLKLLVRR
jgi:hypothetical protein